MAASSNTASAPKISIISAATKPAAPAGVSSFQQPRSEPFKSSRGHNKPKCVKCGNVARSRCPFHSCKSCCSKAQNPCYIHVLKANPTIPDKAPSSSSPLPNHQSNEVSSAGTSHRVSSFRQLSHSFAQFNNVQSPARSKKALTRKDAAAINEWRFHKLKEFKERNIEAEDESFDRYMRNINLLEEVFCVKSEVAPRDRFSESNPDISSVEGNAGMVLGMKLRPKSSPIRTNYVRKKIEETVDQGLMKLKTSELHNSVNDTDDQSERVEMPKRAKSWSSERNLAVNDLIDKLNKVRNDEDLKSCLNMKSKLFRKHASTGEEEIEDVDMSEKQTQELVLVPERQQLNYAPLKMFRRAEIDEDALRHIDVHFSTLQQIENV